MPPRRNLTQISTPAKSKVRTQCQLRLQHDLDELTDCGNVSVRFPEDNMQHFIIQVMVEEGLYRNHKFDFEFVIPDEWPNERPSVKLLTKTWHPNLSEDGGVCVSVLKKNYTPITTISGFVTSFQFLFNSPNPRDPLNQEAAKQYISNYAGFKAKAEEYMEKYCPK